MLGAVLLAAACGGRAPSSAQATGSVIRLAQNDWLAANVNDAIATQLLVEKLGFQVEHVPLGTSAQFDAIASGAVHASLEVWPGGHLDQIHQHIAQDHTIEDVGPLGPIAKAGWWIPTYLLADHPELATWDGFKLPLDIALFKTPETGDLGRFLGGDPSWKETDQTIIENLGLKLQVVFAGSEDLEIAELDARYKRREPLVMYFWSPHWVHAVYDLTNVALPPYTPECWATVVAGGSAACDYPTDHLFKMSWAGLADYAPAAYRFLKAMRYTTKTQLDVMAAIKIGGLSVTDAAREWIAANPTVWQPWIDAAKSP